jgi:hypothetical protein
MLLIQGIIYDLQTAVNGVVTVHKMNCKSGEQIEP